MSKISGKECFEKLFNSKRIDNESELIDCFIINCNSESEQKILKDLLKRSEDCKVNLNGLSDELFDEVMREIKSDTDSNWLFDEREDYFPDNAYYALLHFMFDTKTELACIIEADAGIYYFDSRKAFQDNIDEMIKDWEDVGADT